MTEIWKLTTKVEDLIATLVKQAGIGPTDTPSLMWASGGSLEAPGKPPRLLPAHYGLGWVAQPNLHAFKTIPSARFGQIVFHPRPEDEASTRRTIDYDGTDIIVR